MTLPIAPDRILKVLARHGVDYVVIGGMEAILQGVELPRTLGLRRGGMLGKIASRRVPWQACPLK